MCAGKQIDVLSSTQKHTAKRTYFTEYALISSLHIYHD